jgi:hypothetical protein
MRVRTGFGGKARRKETIERLVCRWDENIKIDLKEMRWVWNGLIWLRIWTRERVLLIR